MASLELSRWVALLGVAIATTAGCGKDGAPADSPGGTGAASQSGAGAGGSSAAGLGSGSGGQPSAGAGGLSGSAGNAAGDGGTPAGTAGMGGTSNAAGLGGAGGGQGGTGGSAATAGVPTAVTSRSDSSFNTDWKYVQDDVAGAEDAAFDDASWQYVDLPHTTKFVTPDAPNADLGVSFYRKHFALPADMEGLKVFLEFGAAMQLADVWVNGTHRLQHQGGYTPFTIDITEDVTYGGADNVVAVKLDNNANAAWAPGWNGVDFQYHGGLYRNVTLHVMDRLHVTDAVYAGKVAGGGVFVTYPAVETSEATVSVKTHVINESSAARDATVLSELLDSAHQVVGTGTSTESIGAGEEADFEHSIVVENPRLWHPDSPNLYTVRTTVLEGATPVDTVTTRIGIRRIDWSKSGGLSINGARFKAFGANVHQETYGLGNAVPDSAVYYDMKRLKEGGMNFARGAHYPHTPAFYAACDELGILVLDAQSGWQRYNDTAAFRDFTYQELRDMIRRDRNHPSVVAWEASLNESNFTDAWAEMADSIVHAEYPGDQAFSVAWRGSAADIYGDASQHDVRTSGDSRPIIINEFSDWDYGGANSTSRQAREDGDRAMLIQAGNLEEGQSSNFALSWYSAGSYWDYADYGGFSDYGITRCGLVDMYRLPKFSYYFMQSQRDPELLIDGLDSGPMVYIANQWTASSPTTVHVYSNCEQVSLYLNDALVATQAPVSGTSLTHPPFDFDAGSFAAGALRADCLIGGEVRATTTRRTPGVATQLNLRPEASVLRADLSDARLVFIEALDENGTVVPTDSSQVSLALTGPGSIVGPTMVTLKGGQLATWVRAGRTAGTLSLSASASGLSAASVALTSHAVPGLPDAPADRR